MPTAKRERKKAARHARLAQEEAARRRSKRIRQGGLLVVVVAIVVVVYVTIGHKASTSKAAAKSTTSTTTAASTSTSAPASPTAVAPTCPATDGSSKRQLLFTSPPPVCITPGATYGAIFKTDVGSFTVSLDTQQAPKTVNAFVFLARYHFYDGVIFHRVIPGFVVQGGDPSGTGSGPYPGFKVAGEVPAAGSYKIGSVAMAKTASDPNGTTASQFFIITGQQGVQLPPQYSLLGQVTSGMAVVNQISSGGTQAGTPTVTHRMLSVSITQT